MSVARRPGIPAGPAPGLRHAVGPGFGGCPPHPDASPAAAPGPDEGRPEGGAAQRRCQRWTLLVVCAVSALLLFNVTAPNVALPDIGRSLGAGFVALQWVLSSYALVLAALLLVGGALGDRYGRKRLFGYGLVGFGVGCAVCAVAPSVSLLVAGRVVQGLGAAALFPAGLALIGAEFAGAARARAIGVWAATVAAAIALGPLLGGLLVQAWGWRAEFAVTALLAVPAIVLGRRHLRESRTGQDARLDWAGTGLLSTALLVAVLALTQGNDWGWTSPVVVGTGVAAVALLGGFVLVEHRVVAPLISPALMRNRTFVAATVVALIFAVAGFAPLTYIAQFLLTVADAGPVQTGLAIAPFAVAAFGVSLLAAGVTARLGLRATLAGGLAVCAAGLALMLGTDADSGGLALLPGLLVFGVGAGVVNPAMTTAALAVVPAERGGMASAVNNAARQFGIAAGIAGLGALVQARLAAGVEAGLLARGYPVDSAVSAGQAAGGGDLAAAGTGAPPGEFDEIVAVAYADALNALFLAAIGIALLGAIVVLALIRVPAPAPTSAPTPPAGPDPPRPEGPRQ